MNSLVELSPVIRDVGIDVGKTRLAIAIPSLEYADSIDLPKAQRGRRDAELRALQAWLTEQVAPHWRVWIDKAFSGGHGGKRQTAGASVGQWLSETATAVKVAVPWQYEPVDVHSATWKARVIGNHLASKAQIQEWLKDNRPSLYAACSTEDEYDAMVIGLYGVMRIDGTIAAPAARKPARRKPRVHHGDPYTPNWCL